MRHFIDFEEMNLDEWKELYALTRDIMKTPDDFRDALRGKVMASLFFEPSTRTNFSFQAAMQKLGGGVFGFSDSSTSSVSKGEKLKDTIIMCSSYADAIVMRTPWDGAARAASLYSSASIINAGDGGHLHPTQTLTDLATISERRGSPSGMNIGFCGDLKNGRTVHSLIEALCRFENVNIFLISPRELALPQYVHEFIRRHGVRHIETTGLEATLPQLDVLYMTRIQRERFTDQSEYEKHRYVYVLDAGKLKLARRDMMIMHPLPRVDEIALDVDGDSRASYFRQAECGLYVRMALLLKLIGEGKSQPAYVPPETMAHRCTNPRCITATEKYLPLIDRVGEGVEYCGYCDKEL